MYKKYGKFSQTAIQGHFGTWKNALSLAGLRTERTASELKLISDDDYFADLRRVAALIEKDTVPYEEYRQYGKYSAEYIITRFKKWNLALEKAGLSGTGFSKDKITELQCFEEIERMWIMLGRQPTATDITKDKLSIYSLDTYKRRFGGWRKALEAFVCYVNDDESSLDYNNNETVNPSSLIHTEENITESHNHVDTDIPVVPKHKTTRTITVRLRFMVLKRDNFKCCACGASPAKDPSVELHIDHIIPWSKGGETTIDNLQTLCSKCNLGKSDLM
jgi:5-methylcytosine-specific restriction endonuclease McrA